jgi:hypothetical protein
MLFRNVNIFKNTSCTVSPRRTGEREASEILLILKFIAAAWKEKRKRFAS